MALLLLQKGVYREPISCSIIQHRASCVCSLPNRFNRKKEKKRRNSAQISTQAKIKIKREREKDFASRRANDVLSGEGEGEKKLLVDPYSHVLNVLDKSKKFSVTRKQTFIFLDSSPTQVEPS